MSKKNIKGEGLYIAMNDTYNVNSKIHPKKNSKIFAYSEPVLALLGSFKFEDNENPTYLIANNSRLVTLHALSNVSI